jgi:hypothetical protein
MRFSTNLFVISVFLALWTAQANAQAPVAIVEDVHSSTAGVEFMDYLTAGRTIRLSTGDRLTVGYLKSCWRELITGGTVTVGAEQSEVIGGTVERARARCDAPKRSLTKETAGSGAMVFRKKAELPAPDQTVYSLSPVFELKGPANIIIERLDKSEKSIALAATALQLLRGAFLDLSNTNVVLTAGGLYRAKTPDAEIIIKVDPTADSKDAPIIGRLVRLLPSN